MAESFDTEDTKLALVNHERCGKCANLRNRYKPDGVESWLGLGSHPPKLIRADSEDTPSEHGTTEQVAEGFKEIREYFGEHFD